MPAPSGRTITPELMDDPAVDRQELGAALSFIRAFNRRFGGTRATLRRLEAWSARWPKDRTIRIIDLGTGSADIPVAIAAWAKRRERTVAITAVDRHPTTVAIARAHAAGYPEIEVVEADATRLLERYEPGAFDYAHAGMFLHHLSDVRVLTVLRIMDRLAAQGVIWNDLLRGAIARAGARVLTCGASPMVRHDARVSVEAGFTRREALGFAARVGLEGVRLRTHLGHRFTLASEKVGGEFDA